MAFGIPIVEKLESEKSSSRDVAKTPKVLILEPTRELAKQVGDDFTSISTKIRTCCVYGGVSYERQGKINCTFVYFYKTQTKILSKQKQNENYLDHLQVLISLNCDFLTIRC